MIAGLFMLSVPVALVSDPEVVKIFTNSFITDIVLIWDKMVVIFQLSDEWTYLKSANKNNDEIMGYNLIYNHYLDTSNIDHMAAGAEKNLAQCTFTG